MTASTRKKRFDWQAHRDEIAVMLAAGATGAEVARHFEQRPASTYEAIARLGLTIDRQATRQARAEQCRKLSADPAVRRLRTKTMTRIMRDPDRRAAASRRMQEVRDAGGEEFTRRLVAAGQTEDVRRRRAETMRKRRLGWLPSHLWDEYRWLRKTKLLPANEARAAIQPEIDRFLQTFEGKLWLVETGRARIVDVWGNRDRFGGVA